VGELVSYYAASDIVFVGGSLVKKGGHNILEPASLGKPVICGPFMFNFRDIAEDFLNNGALLTVHNRAELTTAARQLLQDPQKTAHITEKAQLLIRENRGASIRNAQYLRKFIVT
jgi:3-deoxy-D-manno-octulosonic-acid transferase